MAFCCWAGVSRLSASGRFSSGKGVELLLTQAERANDAQTDKAAHEAGGRRLITGWKSKKGRPDARQVLESHPRTSKSRKFDGHAL